LYPIKYEIFTRLLLHLLEPHPTPNAQAQVGLLHPRQKPWVILEAVINSVTFVKINQHSEEPQRVKTWQPDYGGYPEAAPQT
jgi:hypothetical protein